ncbi:hypothetical protein LTR37_014759 [Vermiconidia calcicola]|uniref:Uncharacterized protein n=1 Tax=Vermiconidia calcicola TaxID=1690605 RepID=A0ACC3MTD2_9PEZI|nr:hypothetical protein LTR37_014759 [Vermiconidia calcicola]
MDARNTAQQAPPATSAGMDHSDDLTAEVDEPPDDFHWSPTTLKTGYFRPELQSQRRESLLTRQLHSEAEHTDEGQMSPPPRTLSTQSTWSNPSTGSMAELTSDDGRSVTSPAISPPLGPTHPRGSLPMHGKRLEPKVEIVGHDEVAQTSGKATGPEKSVEADLGRKRCISFACRGKVTPKATPPPPPVVEPTESKPSSPPKRKCMLKFACPTRSASKNKASNPPTKRPVSPPPPTRRPSIGLKHRGSDSTVTHVSPKSVRKNSIATITDSTTETAQPSEPTRTTSYSDESSEDEGKEAMRFHEFGTSEDEPEEWVKESTCHRSRLTVNDTLQKENIIRKTCEEVEEEALEEEEEDEQDDLDDELAAVEDMDEENDDTQNEKEEEDESDDGFHSDDEEGFASTDSEGDDDSDFEWWRPGNASTAATSVEHLDRLATINTQQARASSIGSASSVPISPRSSRMTVRRSGTNNSQTPAMTINRRASTDLPDSTDFVCGTLDEDRPIEQAYINRKKMKDAAKHRVRPQDIDPSFPTSDPEMDEEDDDDVDEVPESDEEEDLMHGGMDELHGAGAAKKLSPMHPRVTSNAHRSPPPPARLRSPPPPKRVSIARSPPPPARLRSPPPAKRVSIARSPPPPTKRARSPAPRKLFGHSPNRMKSPAPTSRMTSPPNSPTDQAGKLSFMPHLGARPALTHTASLPRRPLTLSKLATFSHADEDSDTGVATEVPKRGAIDIVKGVEWKRKRRQEKLYQKACAKAATKGEKAHKVKPGKGAERMRELGLQLQQHHGKAEHTLSL